MTVQYAGARADLTQRMRKLWEEHVQWTRQVIVSTVSDLPDADAAMIRLLQNPKHMEKIFAVYFGDKIATAVRVLLTEHLTLAVGLVRAARAGDEARARESERLWYKNADTIAHALNSINQDWPEASVRDMMHEHLRLTKSEAVARLKGQWDEDIKIYEMIDKQAMMMADMLTDGIVRQYPATF